MISTVAAGARASAAATAGGTTLDASPSGSEDHVDARQSLRALLEHEGHRVEEAADGTSGLALAETIRPDVVLVDIGLPSLDGYEVARHVRAARGAAPILVAITGYGQADDRRRSLEAGFDT